MYIFAWWLRFMFGEVKCTYEVLKPKYTSLSFIVIVDKVEKSLVKSWNTKIYIFSELNDLIWLSVSNFLQFTGQKAWKIDHKKNVYKEGKSPWFILTSSHERQK